MSPDGSVTQWIAQLKAGEEQALEKLRQRYWPYLVRLARRNLVGMRLAAADDEDVASEAFWSFYRSFRQRKLPVLQNREHLLSLLTVIVARKAATHCEHERANKRGKGHVQGESALEFLAGSSANTRGIDQVTDSGLAPDEEAVANDLYSHYVNALPKEHQEIAEQYLANRSMKEIAESRGCAACTVRRKIDKFILPHWRKMATESVNSDGTPRHVGTARPESPR